MHGCTLGAQNTELRQSTKVHESIFLLHAIKQKRLHPVFLPPFSGLFCWAAQYVLLSLTLPQIFYETRRVMPAHLSILPRLAYCFFFLLPSHMAYVALC